MLLKNHGLLTGTIYRIIRASWMGATSSRSVDALHDVTQQHKTIENSMEPRFSIDDVLLRPSVLCILWRFLPISPILNLQYKLIMCYCAQIARYHIDL